MTTSSNGAARRPIIVVGYDGSPASRDAVRLAARRAGASGHMVVVNAYAVPADWLGWPEFQPFLSAALARAETLFGALPQEVPELNEVSWEAETLEGHPAEVVARVASVRDADEIVIGSRGFGRPRALLGSVAHELIHVADRPVTIIPAMSVDRGAITARHRRRQHA
jgi:nucleotide-binding universal stress UspA family protein